MSFYLWKKTKKHTELRLDAIPWLLLGNSAADGGERLQFVQFGVRWVAAGAGRQRSRRWRNRLGEAGAVDGFVDADGADRLRGPPPRTPAAARVVASVRSQKKRSAPSVISTPSNVPFINSEPRATRPFRVWPTSGSSSANRRRPRDRHNAPRGGRDRDEGFYWIMCFEVRLC